MSKMERILNVDAIHCRWMECFNQTIFIFNQTMPSLSSFCAHWHTHPGTCLDLLVSVKQSCNDTAYKDFI